MILAAWLRGHGGLFTPPSRRCWTWINCIVCLLIIGLIELSYSGAGYFGAGALGEVVGGAEVYLMMAISVLGTYFLVNFSLLVEKAPLLSKGLIWLGQHTLQILCLHLTVMHLIKDILGLPQTNAAESLFVEKIQPGNVLAFFLTLVVTVLLIMLLDGIKGRMARKKAS